MWKSVQKIPKKELIDKISDTNKVEEPHLQSLDLVKSQTGAILVKLRDGALFSIATPSNKNLW